jgi:hypothetical protein
MNVKPVLAAAALTGAVALASIHPAAAQKGLDAYCQTSFRDAAATIDILSHNDKELGKIGKGYVQAYGLKSQEIWCKEPNQVRFQGKKGFFTIRYVTSGTRKLTEVPTLRIHKVENISKEPGKGDSIADLGVITPSWADAVEARWVRADTMSGKPVQVFEYWRKEDPRSKHTVSIDPTTRTIVENISHHRSKKKPGFKKRLVYSETKQISGVWMPTKVSIYNGENKLAAEMRYESIKINSGLDDKLFKF